MTGIFCSSFHHLHQSPARHSLAFIVDLSCKLKPVGGSLFLPSLRGTKQSREMRGVSGVTRDCRATLAMTRVGLGACAMHYAATAQERSTHIPYGSLVLTTVFALYDIYDGRIVRIPTYSIFYFLYMHQQNHRRIQLADIFQ